MPVKKKKLQRRTQVLQEQLAYDDPERIAMVCGVKERSYETPEAAEADLRRLIDAEGFDPTTQAFPCLHCGYFHIGRALYRRPGRSLP